MDFIEPSSHHKLKVGKENHQNRLIIAYCFHTMLLFRIKVLVYNYLNLEIRDTKFIEPCTHHK